MSSSNFSVKMYKKNDLIHYTKKWKLKIVIYFAVYYNNDNIFYFIYAFFN